MSGTPVLSVVVVIVSDTIDPNADARHLGATLDALAQQKDAPPLEIVVPHHANVAGLDALKERFPDVRFLLFDDAEASSGQGREHHDVLRSRGMAASHGELVGLLEDHAVPDERWCASVVAAHREGPAAVGGAIENGVDRALNWAVYFCDFGRYQNPVPAGESPIASDANVVYKRSDLDLVKEAWQPNFREVVVNGQLHELGKKVVLDPAVVIFQNRTGLGLGDALRERFVWARSYAETRSRMLPTAKKLVYAVAWPILPPYMLLRMGLVARERRRRFGKFLRAAPVIALLLLSWSVGEGVGYLKSLR